MQMEEGIFRHKKLRRITHSTICINSTNIADFNIFSIIHLKHFQAHTVFTRISVNKTFVCSLTVAERVLFRQNGWSCHSAISTWRRVNPVSIFYFYYRRRSNNNIKMMIKISLLIVISNIFTLIFDHVIMLTIINRFMDVIWQLESWCGPATAKYIWPQN